MKNSKWFKGLILAFGFTLVSSVSAFAATAGEVQAPDAAMTPTYVIAGSGTADPGSVTSTQAAVSQDILDRQAEIDQYLFKDHSDEVAKEGFKVTHTAPMDGYVEIGITPYTDANADYIIKALGNDKIKVVEGIEAVPLKVENSAEEAYTTTAVPADGEEIYTTTMVPADGNASSAEQAVDKTAVLSYNNGPEDNLIYASASAAPESAKNPFDGTTIILAAGAAVLLGAAFLGSKKLNALKKQ